MPAIGIPPIAPDRGRGWLNMRDAFGLTADDPSGSTAAANRAGAIAALAAGKHLYLPADGTYYFDGPLYGLRDNVTICGDRNRTVMSLVANCQSHNLVVGLQNVTPPTGTYVPLAGVLDGTQGGGLYGIRTQTKQRVTFWSDPFSRNCRGGHWDNWGQQGQPYTIELAVMQGGGGPLQMPTGNLSYAVMGMGQPGYPSPWTLILRNDGNWAFYFADQLGRITTITWAPAAAAGVQRVAIQYDQAGKRLAVYQDGMQVATASDKGPNGVLLSDTTGFMANSISPFQFGATSLHFDGDAQSGTRTPDLVLCGLKITNSLRYRVNGAGTAQVRRDTGTAPNDRYRYSVNNPDDNSITARVTLTNSGASLPMEVPAYGFGAWGFLFHGFIIGTNYAVAGNRVADLNFTKTQSLGYGDGVSYGKILTAARFDNISANQCFNALGCFNSHLNSYILRLRGCTLNGGYAGIYCRQTHIRSDNLHIDYTPVYGVLADASRVRLVDSHFGIPSPATRSYVRHQSTSATNGDGTLEIDGVTDDNEDFHGPVESMFYCENNTFAGNGACSIRNVDVYGGVGPEAACITLGGARPASRFEARNVGLYGAWPGGVLAVRSGSWYGDMSVSPGRYPLWLSDQTGGDCHVTTIHDDYGPTPPRSGTWVRGCHVLRVPSAAPGQYSEWRCVASGTCGTADPPAWVGVAPLAAPGSNALAAYATSTPTWPPTGPTYLGLSAAPVAADGTGLDEPAGGGYARASVAAWTDPGPGYRTNAAPAAFPVPTAAWAAGRPLTHWFAAAAAAGGNVLAAGPLTVPARVAGASSPPPTWAAGAFLVTQP